MNIATGKPIIASSTLRSTHPVSNVINPDTSGTNFFFTREERCPWIQIDLLESIRIQSVELTYLASKQISISIYASYDCIMWDLIDSRVLSSPPGISNGGPSRISFGPFVFSARFLRIQQESQSSCSLRIGTLCIEAADFSVNRKGESMVIPSCASLSQLRSVNLVTFRQDGLTQRLFNIHIAQEVATCLGLNARFYWPDNVQISRGLSNPNEHDHHALNDAKRIFSEAFAQNSLLRPQGDRSDIVKFANCEWIKGFEGVAGGRVSGMPLLEFLHQYGESYWDGSDAKRAFILSSIMGPLAKCKDAPANYCSALYHYSAAGRDTNAGIWFLADFFRGLDCQSMPASAPLAALEIYSEEVSATINLAHSLAVQNRFIGLHVRGGDIIETLLPSGQIQQLRRLVPALLLQRYAELHLKDRPVLVFCQDQCIRDWAREKGFIVSSDLIAGSGCSLDGSAAVFADMALMSRCEYVVAGISGVTEYSRKLFGTNLRYCSTLAIGRADDSHWSSLIPDSKLPDLYKIAYSCYSLLFDPLLKGEAARRLFSFLQALLIANSRIDSNVILSKIRGARPDL